MTKEHAFAPKPKRPPPRVRPSKKTDADEARSQGGDGHVQERSNEQVQSEEQPRSRTELALTLQRRVGNRAVQALLGDSAGSPAAATQGQAVAVQRDLVSDVKGKLEYSLFGNWVITDAKAISALRMLEGASVRERTQAVAALGPALTERLLENLPSGARSGDAFTHLVALLPASKAPAYIADVLRAGSFRWAIEAAPRFFTFATDSVDQVSQSPLFTRANNLGQWRSIVGKAGDDEHDKLRRWMRSLPRGAGLTADQKDLIRVVFNNSPDGQLLTLLWCIAVRFNVKIGPSSDPADNPDQWDAAGLRRMYPVIEALPAGHVEKNPSLKSLTRYTTTRGVSGWYGADNEAAIGYNAGALNDKQQSDVGDALRGVNRFSKVIRHEVGHAVDKQMGWSAGGEPASAKRGGWKQYGANYDACAKDMVASSAGALTTELTSDQKTDVIAVIAGDMGARTPEAVPADIRALPWYAGLPRAKRKAIMNDPVYGALRAALNHPWYSNAGGGPHLGDYVYEESYNNDWNRYRHEARSRKVSQYQFRAPGEWFAEAYAAYYEPDDRGRGARLADNDKDTKKYFDEHVHTHGS